MDALTKLCTIADRNGIVETVRVMFGSGVRLDIPYSEKLCDVSIDVLNLSVRASNSLKRNSIMTVLQVIGVIERNELDPIRNMGKKSKQEVQLKVLDFLYACLSSAEKQAFLRNLLVKNKVEL